MAESEHVKINSKTLIDDHLKEKGIKKDKDVEQLYLANKELTEIDSLSRFNHLRILWLNGNKLQHIKCLRQNFQLEELHLQNNCLKDITGSLRHLTSLKVLMLQNNQLTKLEHVIKEFMKMQCLEMLNLFDNPVAQEKDYRLFVIHSVPSLKLLDRQEVMKAEKELGRRVYDQEREKIKETVAFGRRSQGPPEIYYPAEGELTQMSNFRNTALKEIGDSFRRDNRPHESEEDAINSRRGKKSLIVFTTFDWGRVPRVEDRRQSHKDFDTPELITHVYR